MLNGNTVELFLSHDEGLCMTVDSTVIFYLPVGILVLV